MFMSFMLLPIISNAADIPALTKLFTETFKTHYDARFCGMNITRLVESAMEAKIDMKGASLMKLESDAWNLQCVSARGNRPGSLRPFEKHWVLFADGWVFDYDFTDKPKVIRLSEYIEEMFIPNFKPNLGNYDPERSIRGAYQATLFDATEYYQNKSNTQGMKREVVLMNELIDMDELFERVRCKKIIKPDPT